MASLESLNTVQKEYIAYYQRPGDPPGLLYWADRLEAPGGSLEQIIDAFGDSPEALALYGPINSVTIGFVIDEIYLGLFDRLPDAAGKQFYIDGFNNGTYSAAGIANAILMGAQNQDAVSILNKCIAANRFSETVDGRPMDDPNFGEGPDFAATYGGSADADAGRAFLDPVNANPTTIPSQFDVTTFIQQNIADPGDPIVSGGVTKTLTTGTDFVDLSNSALYDTVIGVTSAVPGSATLTNGDTVKGGGNTVLQLFTDGGPAAIATVAGIGASRRRVGVRYDAAGGRLVEHQIYQLEQRRQRQLHLRR